MAEPNLSTPRPCSFAAAVSTSIPSESAVEEVLADCLRQLGNRPSLALLFATHEHTTSLPSIVERINSAIGDALLCGCTAESIVATNREIEDRPAIALWMAALPDVDLQVMHLRFVTTPDGGSIVGWSDALLDTWPDVASMLVLGEPFSFPTEVLLELMNNEHPGMPLIGGMASGAAAPGANRLVIGDRVVPEGAVGILLSDVRLRSVVSQGCRPIGRPLVVTQAERNLIRELGGHSAVDQLRQVFEELPNREQHLLQQGGLHVGRVVSEYQAGFTSGDFLVRNVLGIDPENGIAIGDYVRVGQTIQFHLRDQETADLDLRQMLAAAAEQAQPAAALVFTCNGRGSRMFDVPGHDAASIHEVFGGIPVAGLFAQGEIGPVGGQNFMHGFTASIALFEHSRNPG